MTENGNSLTDSASAVRRFDPDRYFSALFAPAQKRPALMALYAFNHELARIAESVREPMLGEIRLQWWRESFDAAQRGAPRAHDVARSLQHLHETVALPQDIVDALIDARAFDFSPDRFETVLALEDYLDRTSGGLMRLAACVLGEQGVDDSFAREAGIAYGLVGLLRAMPHHARRGKLFLPSDVLRQSGIDPDAAYASENRERLSAVRRAFAGRARAHYQSARRAAKPGKALVAFLPATLVPLDLRRLNASEYVLDPHTEAPLFRRQMALLAAAVRGHI
jgi:phytoene/squalene synthetase